MSDLDNKGKPKPEPAPRVTDEFVTRLLAESGKRTPALNQNAQATIMKALLAENARLLQTETRAKQLTQAALAAKSAKTEPSWLEKLLSFFTPQVQRGLGGAFAALLLASMYVVFGGTRGAELGRVNGDAALKQVRVGPFGWRWALAQNANGDLIRGGDELTAYITTTLTLNDGSTIVVSPGATISMLPDGSGLILEEGTTEYDITHSLDGKPKFKVDAAGASFVVKGTHFRIRRNGAMVEHFTDEGRVGANAGTESKDVSTGEQVIANAGKLSDVQLQTPSVTFGSANGSSAVTNRPSITMTARIYPNATLFVVDTAGKAITKFVSDKVGDVRGKLDTPLERDYTFRFYVVALDGRKSATSDAVTVKVDRTAPAFSTEPLIQNGDTIVIRGKTEPNVRVSAGEQSIRTSNDGSFDLRIQRASSMTSVRIVFTDDVGNSVSSNIGLK